MGDDTRITLRPRRLAIRSGRRRPARREAYGGEVKRYTVGWAKRSVPTATRRIAAVGTLRFAHPTAGDFINHNGADAVLSDGRYCIGSTGAEFLRISK